MHSLIERSVKHTEIFGSSDYADTAKNCCVRNPYKVQVMDHNRFIDWGPVNEATCSKNAFEGISNVHRIAYEKERDKVTVTFRKEIDPNIPGMEISYNKRGRVSNVLSLPTAYSKPVGVDSNKKADLLALCKYLPYDRRGFYETLPVCETRTSSESRDGTITTSQSVGLAAHKKPNAKSVSDQHAISEPTPSASRLQTVQSIRKCSTKLI